MFSLIDVKYFHHIPDMSNLLNRLLLGLTSAFRSQQT